MQTPESKVKLEHAPVALVFLKGGVFGGIQRKWYNYVKWYNGFWEARNAERTPRENPYADGETQANHVTARNNRLQWVCVLYWLYWKTSGGKEHSTDHRGHGHFGKGKVEFGVVDGGKEFR